MRSPAYSFGSRHEKKSTASAPAPNSYNTSGLNPRGKDSQNTSVTLILIKPYLIYMDVPFCNRIFFDEVSWTALMLYSITRQNEWSFLKEDYDHYVVAYLKRQVIYHDFDLIRQTPSYTLSSGLMSPIWFWSYWSCIPFLFRWKNFTSRFLVMICFSWWFS